ncbi:hypothetical protein HRbin08_00985 [bacterium HR08]|nr:hypothetical protein HRbin08_00985 [bacterium HR08]
MLFARSEQLRLPQNEHILQPAPLLVVFINEQRDARIRANVPHALQARSGDALGLCVEDRVERHSIVSEADGHHVRFSLRAGRRQARHARSLDQRFGPRRQHTHIAYRTDARSTNRPRDEALFRTLTARFHCSSIDAMTARGILFNAAGRVRAGWRASVFFALFFAFGPFGGMLLGFLYGALTGAPSMNDRSSAPMGALGFHLLTYGALIGGTLAASAICLRWLDRRPFRSLGLQWRERGWWEYTAGFGLAAGMMTALVLATGLLGRLHLSWAERPLGETIRGMLTAFLFFNVAAAFEELLFRGYPLQTLLLDVPPAIAVSAPSLLFGLGHMGNPNASTLGVCNTVLAGVWLSIAYLKTRRLWLPIGLHAGWNFTMSAIYGLTVSGIQERIGASLCRAVQDGPAWLTGGSYGPEGGLLATGVLIGTSLWLWRTPHLRPSEEAIAAR